MIVEELVENGERIRHYSDQNLMIRQIETGEIYQDAVDVLPCQYTYEETDQPIPETTTHSLDDSFFWINSESSL